MKYKIFIGRALTALVTALTGLLVRRAIDLFFKLVEKWSSMLLTGEWLSVIMYL
jgi:hypothetical protein